MRVPVFSQCALFLAAVDAASLEGILGRRDGLAVVAFDTVRSKSPKPPTLRRRQPAESIVAGALQNGLEMATPIAQYFTNLTIGTPPQTVMVQLDTGSNDLVINSVNAPLCKNDTNPCAGATYNANTSSSYNYLSSNASLGYDGGDLVTGDFATDTLKFGNTTIKDVQMVVSYNTTSFDSIWGLSYAAGEQGTRNGGAQYPSILEIMVSSGAIQSNAYSLWLNSQYSPTGSLLLGGVNKGKYSGPLNTIPLEVDPNQTIPTGFIVTVTGVGLTLSTNSQTTDSNISIPLVSNRADPFAIDSGTWNIEMPMELLQPILNALGAEYESASEEAMVPCSMTTNTSTLDFMFTSFKISVPLTEFIFPQSFLAFDNEVPTLSDGKTPACLLGIQPAGENFVFGDTFMRSAYIVFDLDNNEVSMAQANIGAADTQADDIVEISTGSSSVPGATKVANPVRAFQNETAIANNVDQPTGTWSFYETVSTTFAATKAPTPVLTNGVQPTGTATTTGSVTAATASKAAAASMSGDLSQTCLVVLLGFACLM